MQYKGDSSLKPSTWLVVLKMISLEGDYKFEYLLNQAAYFFHLPQYCSNGSSASLYNVLSLFSDWIICYLYRHFPPPKTYRHGRLCVNGGVGSLVSVYRYPSFSRFYFTSGLQVTVIKETEEAGVEDKVTAVVTRASPSLRSLLTQLT